MTDREKLIEILRVPIYPHELADPAEVVADYLLDNGVTIQQWIPATERLPEHSDNVLVCVTDSFANVKLESAFLLAEYCKEDGWILEMWPEIERPNVTHWMPLPEPPKENI